MMHPDSKSKLVPFCVLANFAFCMSFGLLFAVRNEASKAVAATSDLMLYLHVNMFYHFIKFRAKHFQQRKQESAEKSIKST